MLPLAKREVRRHRIDRGPDQRDVFQRDRDRVLYSPSFRRLADVTQVVQAVEGPVFHNRLTHSLKVAQIGRRLAEYLVVREKKTRVNKVGGVSPDVVETAALAHDLGHPPFGHVAEHELDQCLTEESILDGFEGNAQSFRIVTRVAIRNLNHPGLNLTLATLNAILKYPWPRGTGGKALRKWGYYHDEKADFEEARGGSSDPRRSAEAELMDWADDVTYAVHDADDFYRAGIIPLDRLLKGDSEERAYFFEQATILATQRGESLGFGKDEAAKLLDGIAHFSKAFNGGLLQPFRGTREQRSWLDFLSAILIRRYVVGIGKAESPRKKAVSLNPQSTEDPESRLVTIDPLFRKEVDLLKELARVYVFGAPALVAQQFGQRRVIRELFNILHAVADGSNGDIEIIPEPFRSSLRELGKVSKHDDKRRQRARIVADVIASMTERQALLIHARLTGQSPGSIRDVILY